MIRLLLLLPVLLFLGCSDDNAVFSRCPDDFYVECDLPGPLGVHQLNCRCVEHCDPCDPDTLCDDTPIHFCDGDVKCWGAPGDHPDIEDDWKELSECCWCDPTEEDEYADY